MTFIPFGSVKIEQINSDPSKALDVLINEKIGNANPSVADETNLMNFLKKVHNEKAIINAGNVLYLPDIVDEALGLVRESPQNNFTAGRVDGDFVYLGISNTLRRYNRDNVRVGVSETATSNNLSSTVTDIAIDNEHAYIITNGNLLRKFNKTTLALVGTAGVGFTSGLRVIVDATHVYVLTATQLLKYNKTDLNTSGTYTLLNGANETSEILQDATHVYVGGLRYLHKITKSSMTLHSAYDMGASSAHFTGLAWSGSTIYAAGIVATNPQINRILAINSANMTAINTNVFDNSTTQMYGLQFQDDNFYFIAFVGSNYLVHKVHLIFGLMSRHIASELTITSFTNNRHSITKVQNRLYVFMSGRFVSFEELFKIRGYRRVY